MPPSTHSLFGASSSERWINCPASVALCAKAPKGKSSFQANEGTAAHELAEMSLLSKKMPKNFIGQSIKVDNAIFEVDEEMADFVSQYVLEVLKVSTIKNNPGLRDVYQIETKFNLDWLGRTGMWGTCDAHLADKEHRKLHVFDLKYGEHSPVVAENNFQLMYYALGILGAEGPENFDTVRLCIVQPRCEKTGTTEWEISVKDLIQWAKDVLIKAYDEACGENPKFGPSEKACKWCNGRAICPKIMKDIEEAASIDANLPAAQMGEIEFPAPEMLSDEQIVKILHLMPRVKPYFDSVAELALMRALDGDVIEGFKLVKGRQGNRAWVDEDAVEEAFKEEFGDGLFEKKILSPAKLEKLLGSKRKKEVEPYTVRADGKLSLAPLSDKREAIEPNKQNVLEQYFGEEAKE